MKRLTLSALNPRQRARIERLFQLCRETDAVGLTFSLPAAGTELIGERYFLLYDRGELISAIHLFYPDGHTADLIGFTHPSYRRQGYFKRLLETALDFAEEAGLSQVYLLSDGRSTDTKGALEALGLTAEYCEYMLQKKLLSGANASDTENSVTDDSGAVTSGDRTFRQSSPSETGACTLTVTEEDTGRLAISLFTEIFGIDSEQASAYLEETAADEHIHSYLLIDHGQPIGQAQITCIDHTAYLSGFGLLAPWRGKGFGRYFLSELERILAARSIVYLTLQVGSQNPRALSFYRKNGFTSAEELRYYPLFEED